MLSYTHFVDFPDAAEAFPSHQIARQIGERVADVMLDGEHQRHDSRVGRYVWKEAEQERRVLSSHLLRRRFDARTVKPPGKRLGPIYNMLRISDPILQNFLRIS